MDRELWKQIAVVGILGIFFVLLTIVALSEWRPEAQETATIPAGLQDRFDRVTLHLGNLEVELDALADRVAHLERHQAMRVITTALQECGRLPEKEAWACLNSWMERTGRP